MCIDIRSLKRLLNAIFKHTMPIPIKMNTISKPTYNCSNIFQTIRFTSLMTKFASYLQLLVLMLKMKG